jgi:hypothetical protein
MQIYENYEARRGGERRWVFTRTLCVTRQETESGGKTLRCHCHLTVTAACATSRATPHHGACQAIQTIQPSDGGVTAGTKPTMRQLCHWCLRTICRSLCHGMRSGWGGCNLSRYCYLDKPNKLNIQVKMPNAIPQKLPVLRSTLL